MAAGIKGRKSRIPFGPFLAAGAVVALFYGDRLLEIVDRACSRNKSGLAALLRESAII